MSRSRRPPRLRLLATVSLALTVALLAPACATIPTPPAVGAASGARAFVLDRTAHHLYDASVPVLTREVARFLAARGYPVEVTAPGRVETGWAQTRGRATVVVWAAGPGRSRLMARLDDAFLKVPPFADGARDLDLEWAILRHLEPRTAQAILRSARR